MGFKILDTDDGLHILDEREKQCYWSLVNRVKEELEEEGCYMRYDCEAFFLRFLRVKNFEVDQAFKLLSSYIRWLDDHSDLLPKYRPSKLKKIFDDKYVQVGKFPDQHGRSIVTIDYGAWNVDDHGSMDDLNAAGYTYIDQMLYSSIEAQKNGIIYICDVGRVKFSYIRQFTLRRARQYASFLNGVFPCKVKQIHVLNVPIWFDFLYGILKPFLKTKIQERFILHGNDYTKLRDHVDPSVLPKYLGGHLADEEFNDRQLYNKILKTDAFYCYMSEIGFRHGKIKSDNLIQCN